ncbi:phage tail spike protein [Macrococcus psychrotolerans]|uniref:Phage tail spike protein n=1 Tax=Macrococcus psychrotolerans TaxID=3039389 RepID=A0AAT9P3R2_9STAP|nr:MULTISPECIES: phage tail spike protein [Macrococcus]QYA32244.1 phage tail protein [Macrococcus sp. 19Msa1099]QYA37050.1 phage tail protein [Macrococcus caseolyticus]QYA75758.1 phage tail protein [Macrococcus caseolyticus]
MYTVNLKRFDNTDKVTIWDYRRDDNIMKSGTLDKSVDQIDEFKFELINDSRQFESFLTLVEIKNELKNNIVFRGRILIPSQHMAEDGIFNSDYTVEGAAAYMHDSYPSYKFFESATPKSYITFLVNEHNKQVESYKQIKLGAVNFTMKEQVSEAVEYDTTKYAFTYLEKTIWQHIVDDCIGRWGGEILVRYEADGTYIDWLDPLGTKKDAALRIGKNIKSFSKSIDPTNVVTRLIPLGPAEESAAGQSQRLTIVEDSRSGGKNYIDIPELQKIYGIQNGIEIFEDEYTPDTLYNAAKRKVDDIKKNLVKQQMQINLLDLSYIGIDPDEYERGHQYEVFFEPFDVKEWVRIISTNEDITNPHNKSVVIGEKPLSIDDVQKSIAEQRTKLLQRKLDNFNQKLNDSISNVNTIVQDTLDTELQYYEKKIIKGDIPPTNAVNDVFWLDTSNPNVPILKRYWEGQWIKASVDNVEDIGGITREKALFSELSNTFINLTIQHSKLLNEMHEVMNSEYLVDEDIKTLLNSNLDKTVTVFNNIKTNLESMNEDTATIGKLIDTQALFLKYREQLQALYKVIEQAKLSIDARFKLLQTQYTEEKWNDALDQLVSIAAGLERDENGRVIGKIDTTEQINKVLQDVKEDYLKDTVQRTEYTSDKEGIVNKIDETKSEVLKESNQIAQSVSKKVYDNESKTLNQTLSQYINSISTGHQFTYDENGNISDFTVGSSGIKLNGRVIDMNDGDVIIKNGVTTITDAYIPKLFSKKATIEYLDAIGITARTLQARDKQASVNIENGSITMNRDNGARMDVGLDGIQSFNSGGSLRFSLTQTLVTTSAVGTSVSNVYLGTAPTGEARVVDMNGIPGDGAIGSYAYRPIRTLAIKFPLKANGYIGLDGDELRVMSDGLLDGGYKDVRAAGFFGNTLDVNTYANGTHLYLRPTRDGEVKFTNIGTTDVYTNTRAGGTYTTFVDFNGHATGGHLYLRPKGGHEVKLTYTGTTDQFASLRSNGIYVPWIDFNGQIPGSHLYIRPGSGGEVRFTRTGTTDQFINIKANDGDFNQISYNKWVQKSREEWKTGIRKWEVNASEVLTNEVDIYEFYYKNDLDYLTRGSVIGDGYKVPDFWLSKSKNGIDNTSVIWTLAKALQEQIEKNNKLENKINIIMEMI